MTSRKLKSGYFVLEWLNSYATMCYFSYLFFFLRQDFGFGNQQNLLYSAANGFCYMLAAWIGGQAAQRFGCFSALRFGFSTMLLAMLAGSQWHSPTGQLITMLVWTVGMSFSWPALEALISENESRAGLPQVIGIYNIMWSSGAAVAFFTGGALIESLGRFSLFWLPAGIHLVQLILLTWLQRKAAVLDTTQTRARAILAEESSGHEYVNPQTGKTFLRLAWLANPFAYVAMNTLIPVLPEVAAKLQLSTTLAGVVGSVWLFARLTAFIGLWRWNGWHYRFGWLATAYIFMVVSFALVLLVPQLLVILLAEIVFGLCVGLIYYSSLFYSMDVGETKGEHGGFHEALIGMGIFLGPAVGTSTLRLFPATPQAGIWAVGGLLVVGLGLLVALKSKR